MLVASFPADAFGTNCYVVATAPGEQCVVVDPGIGVLDRLDAVLAEHRLHPAAVLLTHGHLDHTFSVAPVCGARGVTAYVHPADRELLADPGKALSMDLNQLFGGRLPYTEPDDVAELTDGATLSLAGLEISVDHAPGHTGGSVLFRLPAAGSRWDAEQVCLSGDVLFAGSIGRTDLWGGSMPRMLTSLREKILPLADDTVVLPGHGPATTIGRERVSNPYLLEVAASGDARPAGPRRGL
ncbi:MBL fold metallo-hydrolase [Micromonospora sp. DT233]|uniref:MBL fold metallo-hydrolase n=1 Tax=Micromonospora sp. DT233 TaxID=3393432 RepID=UPI003CF67931